MKSFEEALLREVGEKRTRPKEKTRVMSCWRDKSDSIPVTSVLTQGDLVRLFRTSLAKFSDIPFSSHISFFLSLLSKKKKKKGTSLRCGDVKKFGIVLLTEL